MNLNTTLEQLLQQAEARPKIKVSVIGRKASFMKDWAEAVADQARLLNVQLSEITVRTVASAFTGFAFEIVGHSLHIYVHGTTIRYKTTVYGDPVIFANYIKSLIGSEEPRDIYPD